MAIYDPKSLKAEEFINDEEIRDTLMGARAEAAAAYAPKVAKNCPHCGATCVPDANGCCEYCGGAMG